jgi:DNA polymerase V
MPEKILYKEFGINAELLIDHAYGVEPCTIADIKAYKGKSRSVSSSQILFKDYDFDDAKTVLLEMVLNGCYNLINQKLVTKSVTIYVGYSKNVIPATGGTAKMVERTNLYSIIKKYVAKVFDDTTLKNYPIRKIGYCFNNLVAENQEEYDLFTDFEKVKKEKNLSETVINLKRKFGKNTLLRAIDLTENATAIMRNNQVGGHNGE